MALTRVRRQPAAQPQRNGRLRISGGKLSAPAPGRSLDGLTTADLYWLRMHGAADVPGDALTAAALDVTAKNAMDVRRLVQPWQARSMSYYDLVPEHKFAARFMGNLLRRVRLFPALLDPKTNEPEELTDGPVFEAFARIKDPSGGMARLQQAYGTQKYLLAETYLTVSPDRDRGEVWECLSPNELRVQPGGIATRFRAPMLSADQYLIGQPDYADDAAERYVIGNDRTTIRKNGGEALPVGFGVATGPEFREHGPDVIIVYRLWRPHPAYSLLADANSMASLDLLEELVLSTYSVRAQLKSRLHQGGMLALPEEMSFPSLGNNPDEDPNSDLLQERISQIIMAAIGDPGSAAAFSPILLQAAGEFLKDIKYFKFNDNQGALAEITQRSEMIDRYGVGQELPPELFTSKADMTHWNAWAVDPDVWRSYGHPAALEMAEDINSCYLQPAVMGDAGVDWRRVCIGIDPAAVIYHPNRAQDAKDAFDRLQISDKVYRDTIGFNDLDAPSQEEKDQRAGLAIRDGSLYRYGIPSVRANIEPTPGEVEGAAPINPVTGGPSQPGPPPEPVVSPPSGREPNPGPNATGGGPAITSSAAPSALLALAEAAVHRARELAGARLRAMTTGRNSRACEECAAAIAGLPNWRVASTLGESAVVGLAGPDPSPLVAGSAAWLAAMLEARGIPAARARDVGLLVERHAAGSLYKPEAEPFPAAFLRLLDRLEAAE